MILPAAVLAGQALEENLCDNRTAQTDVENLVRPKRVRY